MRAQTINASVSRSNASAFALDSSTGVRSRVVNSHERSRQYFLTSREMDKLLAAAIVGRNGRRNFVMVLLAYRHGFRISELLDTRLTEVKLDEGRIWVQRSKNGLSTEQPMAEDEMAAVSEYLGTRHDNAPWLLISERGGRMTRQAAFHIVDMLGRRAGLGHVHPHQLRHSCGYFLANQGCDTRLIQDYLGHRDPRHTVRYTQTAADRFRGLWGTRAKFGGDL